MKCPCCLRTTSLQHYPSNFPPKNFAMIQILDHSSFRTNKQVDKETCFECGASVASKYCMECKASLCEVCTSSLHTPRTFSTRSIVDVCDKKFPTPTCSSHGGKKMKLFRVSCSEAVCSLCASHGLHKGHDCKIIQEVAASKRKLIEAAILQSKESQARLQMLAQSMRSSEDALMSKKEQLIQELKSDLSTSWIISAIINRCEDLAEELASAAESKIQQLSALQLRNAISESLARASAVHHEALLALGAADHRFMSVCNGIQDKLKESLADSKSILNSTVPSTALACNLGTVRTHLYSMRCSADSGEVLRLH